MGGLDLHELTMQFVVFDGRFMHLSHPTLAWKTLKILYLNYQYTFWTRWPYLAQESSWCKVGFIA